MSEEFPSEERTPAVAWLTVFMGGMLLAGNVAELGGVPETAREWTAWLLAGLILVHGVSLAWSSRRSGEGLRLPRWPLIALAFIIWLGLAWWRDGSTPWLSRETFALAAEAWLLAWVVAATPGTRALSWAWMMVVVAAGALALVAAVGFQANGNGVWLPSGRELPPEWLGRWSGTLPLPGAFGSLMVLAGPPLLVLACVRRLSVMWRILCGTGGFAMLMGAIFSFSFGAWLGVAFALAVLPLVVTQDKTARLIGWWVGIVLICGWIYFLFRIKGPYESCLAPFEAKEPSLSTTFAVIGKTWSLDPWLGGHGASFTDLARGAGLPGPPGGWSYGFSDLTELAATWGLLGLALTAAILGGLLTAGWMGWARLPRLVSVEMPGGGQMTYTPETKVLLAAAASGLSAFVVSMVATRSLNVPAVVFAMAIMAGVLSRNVPQRGGSLRMEPEVRGALCLGTAAFIAVLLVWKVALVSESRQKFAEAHAFIFQPGRVPDAESLVRARADLHDAQVSDPGSVQAIITMGWLELEQARLDPGQVARYGSQAEYEAVRATNLAPSAPEPWVVRALACWLVNRPGDAQSCMDRALELSPNDPAVQYYVKALQSSASRPAAEPAGMLLLPPLFVPPESWPPIGGIYPGSVIPRPHR